MCFWFEWFNSSLSGHRPESTQGKSQAFMGLNVPQCLFPHGKCAVGVENSGLNSASCTSYLFAFLSQMLVFFFFSFFVFLNANCLLLYEQSFKTNSHDDDGGGDDECVTPENELLNLWNLFQHFLYKYESTVKPLREEHDNK